MPTRRLVIDGRTWQVYPSGYPTQYDADEFGLIFVHGVADQREVRLVRYTPWSTRSREQSLAELTEAEHPRLFATSQSSTNSPEAGYAS
jgi:hypothetical protein